MSLRSRRAVLRDAGGALAGAAVVGTAGASRVGRGGASRVGRGGASRVGGAGGGARPDAATDTPGTDRPTPSVEFDAQRVGDDGRRVVVERAVLPDGGFVAIHEGSPTGPTVGSSDYRPPRIHRHLAIALHEERRVTDPRELTAALWRDSDGDGTFDVATGEDRPYLVGDEPIYDTALVFPPTPTPTPEPTPEPAFTDTAVSLATGTPTPPPSPTSSPTAPPTTGDDGAIPGFGVVAAVVAAGAGAIAAWRQR